MNKMEIATHLLSGMMGQEQYAKAVVNFKVSYNGQDIALEDAAKSVKGTLDKMAHLALLQAEALVEAYRLQNEQKTSGPKVTLENVASGTPKPDGWMS